jgi:hypothetical protein|tara:strand:+ start:1606 stop:1833 length:228 start_codon:yes stop_codon:yes gene_type:complete
MESKKELADQVQRSKIFEVMNENNYLKAKIAFSLGALEGISYLLKNEDPLSMDQNREHLKNTVNRVLNDLRKSDD